MTSWTGVLDAGWQRCRPWMVRGFAPGFGLIAFLPVGGLAQSLEVGAQAVAVWHRVNRSPLARPVSEARVVHAVGTAIATVRPWLRARATVNLDGATIPGGELSLGGWGEGFVDRRHPHTYFHELILEASTSLRCGGGSRRCRFGAFVGKGFVPFGSDDPMSRPSLRYPVNHHLAQVLERAVVGAQAGIGAILLEGGLFNGDEPERPSQWPRLGGRFGDSWAVRLSVEPVGGLEFQGSAAQIASPEHRPGAGADQDKRHLAVRLDRRLGPGRIRALGEWARTAELDQFFVFRSWLAEGQWSTDRVGVHYRFESTERPEEERVEPFRSVRPHLENSILGITRWKTHSIGVSAVVGGGAGARASLIGELTHGRIAATRGGAFDLRATYLGDRFTSLSIGLKLGWNFPDHPMGRYGHLALRSAGHH
jgi:hypothetical protein